MSTTNTKRRRAFAALVVASLAVVGCEEPDTVIVQPPPGSDVRKQLVPKEEPAEAKGELAPEAKKTPLPGLTPAPPTAEKETKTTPSGVKYETLEPGLGPTARAGQTIVVHYVGKLDDGRKFDSSRDRNEPAKFSIGTGDVIRGWDEAVPGMRVGELRKLWVPPAAGYGAQGKPPTIPPNAPLTYEIELLKATD